MRIKRKLSAILLTLLVLSGCAQTVTNDTVATVMHDTVNDVLQEQASSFQNHSKSYYSYYLPQHMGRRDSSEFAEVLVSDGNEVLMSLNASAVIADKYYSTASFLNTVTNNEAFYSEVFSGTNASNQNIRFTVSIFQFSENYYLSVRTRYFLFLSEAPLKEMPHIVKDILRVARTTSVNSTTVIAAYSNKENIAFQQQTMSIFSQSIPESGTLAEMLKDYYPDYDFSSGTEIPAGEDANGEFGTYDEFTDDFFFEE